MVHCLEGFAFKAIRALPVFLKNDNQDTNPVERPVPLAL